MTGKSRRIGRYRRGIALSGKSPAGIARYVTAGNAAGAAADATAAAADTGVPGIATTSAPVPRGMGVQFARPR